MNGAALKTALKRFGFDDSDPLFEWLTAALVEIEEYAPWPFLDVLTTINVLAGANAIVTPSDFGKVIGIRRVSATGGEKLFEQTRNEFFEEISNPAASGLPERYILTGLNTIQIYPVPSVATDFQVYYRKLATVLDDDADVPSELPTQYHYNPLVVKAAAIGLMGPENQENRAAALDSQVEGKLEKMWQFWSSRTADDLEQVQDTAGYWND